MEAPLNEVLAAGMILMTGWRGECDLIDPMCGSGTIPIEAALIARNIAPGVFRKGFGFEKWKDYDPELFDTIYNDDSQERPFEHKIYGYDNNPKANAIATRNVKAAGVSREIELRIQPFQQFEQPVEKSIIITNPPYGERISSDDLLGLYQMIGERLKHAFLNNDAWVLSYRDECFDQIGLKASAKIPLYNGALECQFRKYQIFDGKYKDFRGELEETTLRQEGEAGAASEETQDNRLGSERREGFRKERREGFRGERKEGFRGERRDGFRGERKEGFRGERRDGFRGERKEGFRGERRDGFRGERKEGFRNERRDEEGRERRSGFRYKDDMNERPKRISTDDGRPKPPSPMRYMHSRRRPESEE